MPKYFSIRRGIRGFLLLPLTGVVVSCTEQRATEPLGADPQHSVSDAVALVACPSGESRAASASIHPDGGTLTVDGNVVSVPEGALLSITEIGMEVRAGKHMRVELSANGSRHYQFLAPLVITLDYSHCPMQEIARGQLSVWLIDSETGELLQNMGGVDNRSLRQITFVTDHFSGYAIAN